MMGLCNYFLNGHCRFGSKCVNDHIDLKALLKTEVEGAVNGKQWLLSCFGPFKESTVIPNFIQDRSFEEVRLDFFEASKNNGAQQHVNELISQYNDALTKLKQLKEATPETIQLIANIYNQSVQEQKKSPDAPSNNVFGVSNAAPNPSQPQQNPFQMGNIFSGAQQQQQPAATMSAGNIFGAAPSMNPFQATPQSSIFGQKEQQQPAAASNFTFSLGQQQAPQQQQQSIFGGIPQSPPQNPFFASSQPTPPQQQQQMPASSIFGAQTNAFASSMFSSSQQQTPQQPPLEQQNLSFGSSMFKPPQQAPASGIFGSVQSPPQTQPQANPFQQAQTGNIFAQFQAQSVAPQQPAQTNLFAQPVPAATPPQNIFAIQQPQQSLPQTTAAPGSIFQIQQPSTQPSQAFGANPFQTQPPPVNESAYSKPEDLTPDEMQQFQNDTFELGKIPLKPPPKHLCM